MEKKYIVFSIITIVCILSAEGQNAPINDTTKLTDITLQDIVVSASKMNLKIKEMPASVSVVSAKAIAINNINNLNQVSAMVPNFSMPEYGSKLTSPVYIRGIGSRINAPSVGLYVDNVPYFDKSTFSFELFDIEHIEVLRGPQGTLYGRNSMGGLINITTRSPLNFQGNHLGVTMATFGNYRIDGGHYAKINDAVAWSISANYQHNDGFFTNKYLNQKVDNLNSLGLRNRIIFKLSDRLSLENIAGFEQSKQGGYPYALYNKTLHTIEDISYNQKSTYDRKMFSDALVAKYTRQNWEIINCVSYQYFDDAQKIDQDFTSDSVYFAKQLQNQNMISNELSARSKGDSRINWLVGGFGFVQMFNNDVDVNVYTTKQWYVKNYDSDLSGFAFFGQLSVNITQNLVVTGGLRYDNEQSELGYKYHGLKGTAELAKVDTVYPGLKDHVLLPRIAIAYKIRNVNIYASYATGYKAGGFNSTFELPDELMFRHENSRNFEAGVKTSLFGNLIYSDLALFYTQVDSQQVYRTTPSGRGSYLDNSGRSENKGFELSAKNREIHGFEATIAYGYTYSKILEYIQDSKINYNNKFTPYIPRHTFSVQLTQFLEIKNNAVLNGIRFNLLLHQTGATYWDLSNQFLEKRYQLLDAKVIFTRGNIQLDLWGKNLLNTEYKAFLFEASGNAYAQKGRPLQLGINVSVKF